MPFDVQAARKAGYSSAEIAGFMGEKFGLDAEAARKAGWTDDDIVKELSQERYQGRALPAGVQPNETAGAGRGGIGGPTAQEMRAASSSARRGTLRAVEPFSAAEPEPPPEAGGSVLDRPQPLLEDMTFAGATERKKADIAFAERVRQEREAAGPATGTIRATPPEASLDRWSERAGRAVMGATANPRLAEVARVGTDTYLLGPEALATGAKLAVDIANLGSLGLAQPVSDWLGKTIEAVQASKSDRFQAKQGEFMRLMQSQGVGVLDVAAFMASNPRFAAEVGAPSVPSMLVGGAGARLGMALLGGGSGATAGATAANVLMNAGSTFSETKGTLGQKLTAAVPAAAGTAVLGRLGGAEKALAAGRVAGARGIAGTASQETGQEFGESMAQSLGQGTAEGNFDPGQAAKLATAEAAAGGLMGGGAAALAPVRADPYVRAGAAGFHVNPPLLTDTPQDQRKKTEAIFDSVAALYGIPPKAMELARAAAASRPLADLGPAYARFVAGLQARGLAPADISPEVLEALAGGAVAPVEPPKPAGKAGAAPAAAQAGAVSSIESTLRAAGALPDEAIDAAGLVDEPAVPEHMATSAPEIDAGAHDAATSPLNDRPEPTDAQMAAGNYKVGRVRISGLDVSIENPKGSVRRSKADAAEPWQVTMPAHYGYVLGTKGADGDHVDLFVGDRGDNGRFWVVNQYAPDGRKFDEHKVITGVDSAEEAVALYKASFADNFGDRVFRSVSREHDADGLKAVLPRLKKAKPVPAGPLPAGEATELSVEAIEPAPARPRPVPAGESTELAPEVVEPAAAPGPDFTDGMSAAKKKAAELALGARVRLRKGGDLVPRRDAVQVLVDAGGAVKRKGGRRVLKAGDTALDEAAIGRTAMDYAEWLLGQPHGVTGVSIEPVTFEDAMRSNGFSEPEIAKAAAEQEAKDRAKRGRVAESKRLEQPAAAPVAESQAPAPSEPGEGGAAPTRAGGGPAPRRARGARTVMGSELLAEVNNTGGLDPTLLSEFSTRFETARTGKDGRPLVQWRNPMTPQGRLFRAGGKADYSEIARVLEEAGYLEPGSVDGDFKEAGERAKDLIKAALNRQDTQTAAARIEETQASEEAERGAYYAELDAEAAAEMEAEREAIVAANGIDAETLAESDEDVLDAAGSKDTAGAMRALGFTEQEIADEIAAEEAKRPRDAARARADAGEVARPAAEDRGAAPRAGAEEGLTSPSEADLRTQAARRAAGEEADRKEQRRLAAKAKADAERGEFALTGSDRPADVAAAAGQGDLLATAPEEADPFVGDYDSLVGKTIEQQIPLEDGRVATMRMDAAAALRDADRRLKTLRELRACIGRAG